MVSRGWWQRTGSNVPATHLLMNGGRLTVPDDHSGTFLNIYFNAILRGEKLSIVELKTPLFRLFFDIDARIPCGAMTDFRPIFAELCDAVHDFWVLNEGAKMIVCSAPSKEHPDDTKYGNHTKLGFHIYFPSISVNAPIALAFRDTLLQRLESVFPNFCLNEWNDVIDQSVFKQSGLRAVYSCKGAHEDRAYVPLLYKDHGAGLTMVQETLTPQDKRAFVHECSIRTFNTVLTPCAGGQDTIADQPGVHKVGGIVTGRSVALDVYADVLPKVKEALPKQYENSRFVGIFKADHAVMLRSSSRYCQNVGREHRTSTVYFCVTRRGVCQKCYCRKDEHDCTDYASKYYPLDDSVLDSFLPRTCHIVPEEDVIVARKMPSKKIGSSLDSLLHRSRFLRAPSASKKKKPCNN